MKHLTHRACLTALPLLLALPSLGYAQSVQPPTPAEAQAALNQAPTQFTNAQLDQMLAPIALYPDQLLTQVLMAATFPDQLVDAAKWLQDGNNAALKGDDLANALQSLPWDPSVKSLVAFPQIVAMMTNHLDWTEALGAAFANQEVATFARVQFLRERAVHAGQLKSSSQIAVREEASDIIIEPTDPNMIYVPVYNPAEVYGAWPDRDAPPVYIPPPPGFYNGALGAGIGYSVGFGVVAPLWGWGHTDWRRHEVVVDPGRYQHITTPTDVTRSHINIEGQVWHHTGSIAPVPEAQRPHPPQPSGPLPSGTVRPSQVARPAFPFGGAGQAPPHPGEPQRPGEPPRPGQPPGPAQPQGPAAAQPGPRPGEPQHPPEEHAPPHPAQPGPGPGAQPGSLGHPNEAQPAGHPEEHAAPPHPGEHAAPPHPEEHAAPPHPEEHAAPPHPEEHAAPPHPAEHAAPPHPEEHAAPPHPEEHAAPPHPEEHAAPPHPPTEAAPAPHPAAPPPPHPAAPPPAAHPPAPPPHPGGPPPEKKPPPKPGEEKPDQH